MTSKRLAGPLAAGLVLIGSSLAGAQQAKPGPTHESEHHELAFPPLPVEIDALMVPDEEFAGIAARIHAGTATMPERRWWYRAAERLGPFEGMPPADWKQKAAEADRALDAAHAAAAAAGGPIFRWSPIGPNGNFDVTLIDGPAGALAQGRATAVWTHMEGATAVNKDFVLVGFADGGVWKTTDAGLTWTPLTDFQPTTSIGAIDVLPGADRVGYTDATIYVGTGEGNFSGPDKDGIGVLKSADGGRTWAVHALPFRGDAVNIPGQHRIRRIVIDRRVANGQALWVAGDGGVYRSTDGAQTWSLVTGLPYTSAPEGAAYPGGCWMEYATDFVVGPPDASTGQSTLLAAFGRVSDATCAPVPADSRKNNGIYRSTDGGSSWQKISVSGQNGFPAIPGLVGRITLLPAPSNPKHVYVLVQNVTSRGVLGIWDTLDATAPVVAWTAGSTTNFASAQAWYNMTGAVDPTNENRLIVGGLDNFLSNNRGATITAVSGWSANNTTWSHADHHHAIWVDANTYYDANDGGFFIGRVNGNAVTWEHRNGGGLSTLQFYGMGQSAQHPYRINAGLQDNGHAFLDGTRWRETYGGDGGFAAVDQRNDLEAYEEYVYGAIRNSSDGGNSWPLQDCMNTFGVNPPCNGACNVGLAGVSLACVPDGHTAFIAWFSLDEHNQDVMYVGSNWLYRNLAAPQAGKAWQRITTDGANGDFVNGATSSRAYISFIHTPAASPVHPTGLSQVIYVGTSTGRIWRTSDAGLTWKDQTRAPLPASSATTGRFLTWIATDPRDANHVVITYSGWSNSTNPSIPGHVFRSRDGGNTWTDISGALPDEPFNTVAVNPNPGEEDEVYVASDSGVYLNAEGWNGDGWVRINSGTLPSVSVNMLEYTRATTPRRLRAATHGRGIWEVTKQAAASLSLDKAAYGCRETALIALQDSSYGQPSQAVVAYSTTEPGGEVVPLVETPAGSGRYVGSIALTGAVAAADGRLSVANQDQLLVRYEDATPAPGAEVIDARALVDCDACAAPTGAEGGNLRVEDGSVGTAIEGGDGDEFLDNCETARVSFTLENAGSAGLTNVRVSGVTASSPGVNPEPMPVAVAPSLAACGSVAGAVRVQAGGLAAGEPLDLTVEVTADELAARGLTRSFTVRVEPTEQDFVFHARKTFTFEADAEGWETIAGTFERRSDLGGANLSGTYLASSSLRDNVCDEVLSPTVRLGPASTLSLFNQFSTEPVSATWYDRANVGLVDMATGTRATVVPSGGRPYLAEGPGGVCATAGERGWAGPGPGWLDSTFSAADLGAAERAGKDTRISVAYGTDANVSLTGFTFDEVTLTDVHVQGADTATDACPVPCPDLDDADPAVEYSGGWHRKEDARASGGGYHRRTGNNPHGSAARIVFDGTGITYHYATGKDGGTADVYLDGALRQTVSYAGGTLTFGRSLAFEGLAAGRHELRVVHRSGAVYVDGFRVACRAAVASAVESRSSTESSVVGPAEGALVTRTVGLTAADLELSVVVEGASVPPTVTLVNPLGLVAATGQALLGSSPLRGLDAAVSGAGTWTVRVGSLVPGEPVTISIARTTRTR